MINKTERELSSAGRNMILSSAFRYLDGVYLFVLLRNPYREYSTDKCIGNYYVSGSAETWDGGGNETGSVDKR